MNFDARVKISFANLPAHCITVLYKKKLAIRIVMIIHLASEVAPFYKRGGLGDVVGTLPKYMSTRQPNTVISFYYKNRMKSLSPFPVGILSVDIDNIIYAFYYYHALVDEVDYYFLNMADELLLSDMESGESDSTEEDGEKPYGENFPFMVYLYFAKAALQLVEHLEIKPDYMFLHDWHVCGCFAYPSLLQKLPSHCKTVLMIHNYAFQGEIYPDQLHMLEEEPLEEILSIFETFGSATFFALAFKNANYVATVSQTYADELNKGTLPHTGLRYFQLIQERKIFALPNGIDAANWSPGNSPFLDKHYDLKSCRQGKKEWKRRISAELKISNDSQPLVLFMARITDQKGINLLMNLWGSEEDAMQQIGQLLKSGIKLLVYGRPARGIKGSIHKRLSMAQERYPEQFRYIHTYTEEKAHQYLAASDIVLCPSLFEPCGLVQMYALAFGAVPIVRPVGGLKDTVLPHGQDPEISTGFYVQEFSQESLLHAVQQAALVYAEHEEWQRIITRGMSQNYSWEKVMYGYDAFLMNIREKVV